VHLDQFGAVTVYSTKSLHISAPGVRKTRSGSADPLYPFRYDGLRLVHRSGDRYFLLNGGWDEHTGWLIVLRDSSEVRLEFSR